MWNTKRNSESCGVPSVILLVLCIMSYQTSAFVVCNRGYPVPNSISISAKFGRIGLRTPLQMSAVAETKYSSGFKNRMRNILLSEKKRPKKQIPKKINGLPSNMNIITTLEEYRDILESNRDKIIVARFFAKWCKVRLHLSFILSYLFVCIRTSCEFPIREIVFVKIMTRFLFLE